MFRRAHIALLLIPGLLLPGLAGAVRPLAHANTMADPTTWHTFLGGTSSVDEAIAVAVDEDGNSYVMGRSDAAWGAPVRRYAGGNDVFVARLDSNGVLQWHTFLGGAAQDWGGAIAQGNVGDIY